MTFYKFYHQYKTYVHHLSYAIFQDSALAEENVHVCFFNLSKISLNNSVHGKHMNALLAIAARNTALAPKCNTKATGVHRYVKNPHTNGANIPTDAQSNVIRLSDAAVVFNHMDRLQADAVILKYFYLLDNEAVHILLGISPEETKLLLASARDTIKEQIGVENETKLTEGLVDKTIQYAAALQAEKITSEYIDIDTKQNPHVFSHKHKKAMALLFARKPFGIKQINKKKLRITISIALVAIILVATAIYTIEPLRVAVGNILLEVSPTPGAVEINSTQMVYTDLPEKIHGVYLPDEVPQGYKFKELSGFIERASMYSVIFENDAGDAIIMTKLGENSSVGLNNDNVTREKVILNGTDAEFFLQNNYTTLFFQFEKQYFMLSGNADKNEILTMAESMTYYK